MSAPIVRRTAFGWPAVPNAGITQTNLGIIVHYDGGKGMGPGLTGKTHSHCVDYWKNTRKTHMLSNGWNDIGYAFGICPHGEIFEGRGFNRQQAAEEPTPGKLQNGNSRYVSCTFMLGVSEKPTTPQLKAFAVFRKDMMGRGVSSLIHGHRDFTSTDCPGDTLYTMVRNGSLAKAPQEDDMPLSGSDGDFIYNAVWGKDKIAAPAQASDVKTNPTWQPQSYLKDTNAWARKIYNQNVQLAAAMTAQQTTINALVKVVADQTKAFDSTQFLLKLREEMSEALQNLNVHIDVDEESPTP